MSAKSPAFPSPHSINIIDGGLTKREYFTAVALQGMLANPFLVEEMFNAKGGNAASVALEIIEQSVACADRTLKELDKTQ